MNKGWPPQEYLREERKKVFIFCIYISQENTHVGNSVQDSLKPTDLLEVKNIGMSQNHCLSLR